MSNVKWYDEEFIAAVNVTVRKDITKGLKVVQKAAKARCPVGIEERFVAKTGKHAGKPWTARRPGTLKKSIRTRMSKKKKLSGQVIAGGRSSTKLTAYYALIVEVGSAKHGRTAYPYLRPALEESMPAIMSGFEDTLP